jgi:lipopolysaccharide export system ATP-binding protein
MSTMTSNRETSNKDSINILRTEGLKKNFGKKAAVQGIDLAVSPSEVVGLLGPNGAGKTTTFHMITGLIRPNAGRVYLGGNDITRMPMYKRARKGITYLPQEPSVFRTLTVEENLMAVLEFMEKDKKARKPRVEKLLQELDIIHVRKQKAYTLSGGERRRVEIARSLCADPEYFLLGLKEMGIGVLITDHNVREVLSIVDRAYIIFEGRVLIEGSSEFLLNDKKAREIYLGPKFRM